MDPDFASVDGIGAKHRSRYSSAAGAHQSGKTKDLALAQRKADILDSSAATQTLDLQHNIIGRGIGHFRPTVIKLPPDHHADDGVYRCADGRHGGDVLAIAHDGDAIGNLSQ